METVTDIDRRVEERILEIQHRLLVEASCKDSACTVGSSELEEELLDELRDLERMLAVKKSKETLI